MTNSNDVGRNEPGLSRGFKAAIAIAAIGLIAAIAGERLRPAHETLAASVQFLSMPAISTHDDSVPPAESVRGAERGEQAQGF